METILETKQIDYHELKNRRIPAVEQKPEYIFRSKLPDIEIADHLPLHTYCFENIGEHLDRPCLIDGSTGREWTYAAVQKAARKVGAGFHVNLGIGKGEVIMLLLPNCVEFVFAFLGASFIGAVSTTGNPHCTPAEIEKQARASGARAIVTQWTFADKVSSYCKENNVSLVTVDNTPNGTQTQLQNDIFYLWEDVVEEAEDELLQVTHDPNDVVALPYSSGTTGLPKGVMLTHKGLVTSVAQQVDGAAPMGKELEESLASKLPNAKLGQGYGMTEAGPVVGMCLGFAREAMDVKSGSCGTVVRNAELKIVDPQTGFSLPRNQPGEICVRGSQIMKGYLNEEEATSNSIDKDGWLHTGDIGYVDDDEEIFIVDRLKELIKYKGFQVAPAEIEGFLINHPYISDAAVVAMKDEVAGEVPVAFVVKSNGHEITEEDIKNYISKQVVFYKRLKRVFFVDSIPKLPSGKILRKELRARFSNGVSK